MRGTLITISEWNWTGPGLIQYDEESTAPIAE